MNNRSARSRRRYEHFLSLRDELFPGITFREYLTSPFFAEWRAKA